MHAYPSYVFSLYSRCAVGILLKILLLRSLLLDLVCESALALLPANRARLTKIGQAGGILTPMSALGSTLVERMEKIGRWKFTSEEIQVGK